MLGASGAGKSTLLLALAGLLDLTAGDREGELIVRGRAGLVLQDPETQLVMARAGDDVALYYLDIGLGPQLAILAFMVVSAIVIAGIGAWLLMRSLVQTGVLAQFSAGRAQQRV